MESALLIVGGILLVVSVGVFLDWWGYRKGARVARSRRISLFAQTYGSWKAHDFR